MLVASVLSQRPFEVVTIVEHTANFGHILVASSIVEVVEQTANFSHILVASSIVAGDIAATSCNQFTIILRLLSTVVVASSFVDIVHC